MSRFKEELKIFVSDIENLLKPFRVNYHFEFAISVLCFGFIGIYGLYVISRCPVYRIQVVFMSQSIPEAIIAFDLVELFYALEPIFDFTSSLMLIAACVWGVLKLLRHSLVKMSEFELLPITERIFRIEKEGNNLNEKQPKKDITPTMEEFE